MSTKNYLFLVRLPGISSNSNELCIITSRLLLIFPEILPKIHNLSLDNNNNKSSNSNNHCENYDNNDNDDDDVLKCCCQMSLYAIHLILKTSNNRNILF